MVKVRTNSKIINKQGGNHYVKTQRIESYPPPIGMEDTKRIRKYLRVMMYVFPSLCKCGELTFSTLNQIACDGEKSAAISDKMYILLRSRMSMENLLHPDYLMGRISEYVLLDMPITKETQPIITSIASTLLTLAAAKIDNVVAEAALLTQVKNINLTLPEEVMNPRDPLPEYDWRVRYYK